ncbi:MAG: class I SAM-dependent methyltransferase [Bacteroidales bacterium]|nr:class I SAM-dependent methyltransferase [Bacteroidales bacterium]
MNTYFYEVFENIPRQGPGNNSSSRGAFQRIEKDLPAQPEILDIGCGKGVQTIQLAKLSEANITAVDNHRVFLDALKVAAVKAGYDNRIHPVNSDMTKMNFQTLFDLIWSEGAVFIIGIKEGLKQWKKYLKPCGFMVLTDLFWLTDTRPDELTRYLEEKCLYVLTVDEAIREAETQGYLCIDHFTLPLEGWTTEYFHPQKKVIRQLRKKYAGNKEAMDTFDALEYENKMFLKYHDYFGYEFLILRKHNQSQ